MVQFAYVTTLDVGVQYLDGVTDLEIFTSDGVVTLYAGSEISGGLTALSVAAGQAVAFADQIGSAPNRGTYGLAEVELAEVNGQAVLVPGGRHDDRVALHRLASDGGFDGVVVQAGDSAQIGRLEEVATVQVEGQTVMVASRWGESGFHTYSVEDDLSVEHKAHVTEAVSATAHLDAVSAIVEIETPSRAMVVTASTGRDGATTWQVAGDGTVQERDGLDAEDGLWVSDPTALASVDVDGESYLVIGASGSDSLSVAKVNRWGGMDQRDHLIDDMSTRFANLSAMETFTVQGRSYVIAGGSDDGLSLLEIAPGGKLLHVTTLADALDTRLSDVSAIEVAVFGAEVQVFVTSSDESGLSQFSLDFSHLGVVEGGGRFDDTLAGGAADDLLAGYDGDDTLFGDDGDDTLVDGAGRDALTGGDGADHFVLLADGEDDRILDFTPGEDRIDLSDQQMLYAMSQLSFTQEADGVLVEYRGERVRLESLDGDLTVGDLSADDFIF